MTGITHPNPHPHKVLCLKNIPEGRAKPSTLKLVVVQSSNLRGSSANFAMGTDYNDFSSGQSCYGLNPATGAGLWVYFVGAVLALASVPMLLRN